MEPLILFSRNPRFLLSSLLRVLCVIPVTGDAAASCEQHPTRGKQGRAASWTWRLQKACEVLTLSDIEQTLNVTEVHYCSWLEDVAFQRKSAEYLWMLVCSAGAVHKMRFLSTWLLFLLGQHAATHTTCGCGEVWLWCWPTCLGACAMFLIRFLTQEDWVPTYGYDPAGLIILICDSCTKQKE